MGPPGRAPFRAIANSPPVDLAGSAAAEVTFTEYQRGSFRIWHAPGIPGDRDEEIWRAVEERGAAAGADLVPILGLDDEELNDFYYQQFVNEAGAVARAERLTLEQALSARAERLGPRAVEMQSALASANPSEEFRRYLAEGDELRAQIAADGDHRPRPVALTVFRGPIEDVARFLTTGRGRAPQPAELAAALRHWREAHGALLVSADGAGVVLEVARPPRTVEELRAAARQIYLIGPSDAHQGFGARLERADELLASLERSRWECSWYQD